MRNLRYVQVKPKSSLNGDNFKSVGEFDSYLSGRDVMIPKDHFMVHELTWTFDGNNTLASKTDIGYAQNCASTSYFYTETLLNDKLVSWTNDASLAHTTYRLLNESKSEARAGQGSIIEYPSNFSTVEGDMLDNADAITYVNRANGVNSNVTSIISKIPNAFWQSDATVKGNSRIQVRFNIDPSWQTKFVQSTNVNYERVDAPTTTEQYNVVMNDVVLYLRVYTLDEVPRNITNRMDITQWWTTTRNVTGVTSDSININIPTSTKLITIGFFDSRTSDPAVIKNSYNSAASIFLRNLYINVAGQQYPSPQYSRLYLTDDAPTDQTFASDSKDNARAYFDYLACCSQFNLPSGSLMSFAQYQVSPLFCFKLEKSREDLQSQLDIYYQFGTAPTNSTMLVTCFYAQEVVQNYDDQGLVSSLTVSNLHE